MTDETNWRTMETKPEGIFDVLARRYDPAMNAFYLHRFTGCFLQNFEVLWASPFVGDSSHVNLREQGYRTVAWKPAPGPEDIPSWLEPTPSGPQDRKGDAE